MLWSLLQLVVFLIPTCIFETLKHALRQDPWYPVTCNSEKKKSKSIILQIQRKEAKLEVMLCWWLQWKHQLIDSPHYMTDKCHVQASSGQKHSKTCLGNSAQGLWGFNLQEAFPERAQFPEVSLHLTLEHWPSAAKTRKTDKENDLSRLQGTCDWERHILCEQLVLMNKR